MNHCYIPRRYSLCLRHRYFPAHIQCFIIALHIFLPSIIAIFWLFFLPLILVLIVLLLLSGMPLFFCSPLRLPYPFMLNRLNILLHHHSSLQWMMKTFYHSSWNTNDTRMQRHNWDDGRPDVVDGDWDHPAPAICRNPCPWKQSLLERWSASSSFTRLSDVSSSPGSSHPRVTHRKRTAEWHRCQLRWLRNLSQTHLYRRRHYGQSAQDSSNPWAGPGKRWSASAIFCCWTCEIEGRKKADKGMCPGKSDTGQARLED